MIFIWSFKVIALILPSKTNLNDAPQKGIAKEEGTEVQGFSEASQKIIFDRLRQKEMRERGSVVERDESAVRLGHEIRANCTIGAAIELGSLTHIINLKMDKKWKDLL